MLPSRPVRAAPVTLFLLAALQAGPLRAAPVGVRLSLQASPTCTTREELMARVRARSDRIQLDDAADTVVRAAVAPLAGQRAVAGELWVEQPDGRATQRRIRAPSCEQAADALALVLVLALDPSAVIATPGPPPAPRPISPPRAAPAVTAPPAPDTPHTVWAIDAGGWVVQGPAPRLMPGVALGALVARDGAGLWSPALALSWLHAGSGELAEPGGTAAFTLEAAILDLCPVRLARGRVEARGCASALVGRLAAAGSNTYAPAAAQRPFAATGVGLRVAVALPHRLQLGGRLEAGAPWQRDAFAFSPTVFHRAAAVTLAAGLSLGVRFR